MRAKFINEIVKGGSGWSTIGVGHDAMLFSRYLEKNLPITFASWPTVNKLKSSMGQSFYKELNKIIVRILNTPETQLKKVGKQSIVGELKTKLFDILYSDKNTETFELSIPYDNYKEIKEYSNNKNIVNVRSELDGTQSMIKVIFKNNLEHGIVYVSYDLNNDFDDENESKYDTDLDISELYVKIK
jgi:hypothetical protein